MDLVTLKLAIKKAIQGITGKDQVYTGKQTFKGDVTFDGNIVQNGTGKKIELVEVEVKNNYIKLRDGAISGLADGEFTGIEAEKYDGTNNGRLVFDNKGVARVGDVNDEQPLATRAESANITDGQLMTWDADNQKIVGGSVLLTQAEFDALEQVDAHTYYCIIEEE